MTLIKSISGIRGTIGGISKNNFTPPDIIKYTTAYGLWIKEKCTVKDRPKVVVGRDARQSGAMVEALVEYTLVALGIDVVHLGLSTTPTVEIAVPDLNAQGGIILTASHNPKQWNALKLLNHKGEFISGKEGEDILTIADDDSRHIYANIDEIGQISHREDFIDIHINKILQLLLVNTSAIKAAGYRVVVDAVCSTGGIAIPKLLDALGVETIPLYCEPTGDFPHNPEPLKAHLKDLSDKVLATNADFGIAVDPDVDRLALVCEDGKVFGEEYTLVACADYILGKTPGSTVSNLSSSRALKDISDAYGQEHYPAAVGEVNVVEMMKSYNAVIGGEGNGGVIYPTLHYGRDALVGVALFLSLLSERQLSVSKLKATYPDYHMSKQKISLSPKTNMKQLLASVAAYYVNEQVSTIDGVKVDFQDSWVHLRSSNTEPIIRIYTEASSPSAAETLANKVIAQIKVLL